ncbi:MAG TPA: hypothetical protein VGF99_13190 [Myxococcota bacterium]
MSGFLSTLSALVAQVDPNLGAAAAQQGAVQRLQEPNAYDLVFPVIAFGLVIVLPVGTALWVLVRTLKDNKKEPDEV